MHIVRERGAREYWLNILNYNEKILLNVSSPSNLVITIKGLSVLHLLYFSSSIIVNLKRLKVRNFQTSGSTAHIGNPSIPVEADLESTKVMLRSLINIKYEHYESEINIIKPLIFAHAIKFDARVSSGLRMMVEYSLDSAEPGLWLLRFIEPVDPLELFRIR